MKSVERKKKKRGGKGILNVKYRICLIFIISTPWLYAKSIIWDQIYSGKLEAYYWDTHKWCKYYQTILKKIFNFHFSHGEKSFLWNVSLRSQMGFGDSKPMSISVAQATPEILATSLTHRWTSNICFSRSSAMSWHSQWFITRVYMREGNWIHSTNPRNACTTNSVLSLLQKGPIRIPLRPAYLEKWKWNKL